MDRRTLRGVGGANQPSYREGTFTPIAIFAAGSGTIVYSTQVGGFTKIGREVLFTLELKTSDISSRTGNMTIGGLPFTVDATHKSAVSVGFATGLAISAGQVVTGLITLSGTTITVYLWDATTGTTILQHSEWTDDGEILLSGHYIT